MSKTIKVRIAIETEFSRQMVYDAMCSRYHTPREDQMDRIWEKLSGSGVLYTDVSDEVWDENEEDLIDMMKAALTDAIVNEDMYNDSDDEEEPMREREDAVEEPKKAIFTKEEFIERMNNQEQSSKDLAQSIYARTPKSEQAEMAKLLETDLSWDELASMLYNRIPEDELADMAEEEFCDKCGVLLEEDDCDEEGLCNWCAK